MDTHEHDDTMTERHCDTTGTIPDGHIGNIMPDGLMMSAKAMDCTKCEIGADAKHSRHKLGTCIRRFIADNTVGPDGLYVTPEPYNDYCHPVLQAVAAMDDCESGDTLTTRLLDAIMDISGVTAPPTYMPCRKCRHAQIRLTACVKAFVDGGHKTAIDNADYCDAVLDVVQTAYGTDGTMMVERFIDYLPTAQ